MSALELRTHAQVMNRYRRWIDRDRSRIPKVTAMLTAAIVAFPCFLVLAALVGQWWALPLAVPVGMAVTCLYVANTTNWGWSTKETW